MLEFLLALLTTATVGVLLIPLLRAKTGTTGRLDGELAIYRDQLAEIERERAAGTLPESEAAAARIEVERRILAAGDHPPPPPRAAATLHKVLPPALALAIPLLALGLYLQTGRPGLPALPAHAAGRDRARRQGGQHRRAPTASLIDAPTLARAAGRDGGDDAGAAPAGDPRHGRGPRRAPQREPGRSRRLAAPRQRLEGFG